VRGGARRVPVAGGGVRGRGGGERAVDALGEHPSQLSEGIRFWEERLFEEAAKTGAKIGVEHAEEFRVLDLS
jgi:hypothetical protein